jgi:replicative DNA helicase
MSNFDSVDIEIALLGLILEKPNTVNKVKGFLKPDDFYDLKNKKIFFAIESMLDNNIEIEVTTLIEELKKNNDYEKSGKEDYIFTLIDKAGLESNVNSFVKTISNKSQLREVKIIVQKTNAELDNGVEDPLNFIAQVEDNLFSITRSKGLNDFEHSKDIVRKAMITIEKKAAGEIVSGIESEFQALDNVTTGFQKGDLVIIAARPSMGKTAFALNIAANIAKNQKVAFFSLEMPSEQLVNRILSSASLVNAQKLRDSKNLKPKE